MSNFCSSDSNSYWNAKITLFSLKSKKFTFNIS